MSFWNVVPGQIARQCNQIINSCPRVLYACADLYEFCDMQRFSTLEWNWNFMFLSTKNIFIILNNLEWNLGYEVVYWKPPTKHNRFFLILQENEAR